MSLDPVRVGQRPVILVKVSHEVKRFARCPGNSLHNLAWHCFAKPLLFCQ